MSSSCFAIGFGVGTKNGAGEWLEVFYAKPVIRPDDKLSAAICDGAGLEPQSSPQELVQADLDRLEPALRQAGSDDQADIIAAMRSATSPLVAMVLAEDHEPQSVPEAYLKLQLISHRQAKPHTLNLNGLFGVLPNVAWTSEGAIDLAELPPRQLQARLQGRTLAVNSVDKFPRLTDYVVPAGVRIAHTARVRLGAYLGEGTTVMHEGFVNFNAGTEGPGMIEGRISAGVFVGRGSDLGGGCSTMGTLSGGGNMIIAIGEECLIGANAGVGIPLGDRCTIEAGLYLTAGSLVSVIDDQKNAVERVKARDLAGQSDLLFRRNSTNGAIECLTNKSAIELNEALHAHN